MNKMNKKGFTLIEMLVVIAIIAVLVSIIIPIIGNSTEKATAAVNAANLRAVQAEIATAMLANTSTTIRGITVTANTVDDDDFDGSVTFKSVDDAAAKTGHDCKPNSDGFDATYSNDTLSVTFDGLCIDCWAAIAGS